MDSIRVWRALCGALFCVAGAWTPGAEVSVSITISGSIEELIPVLQKLRELGIGSGAPAIEADPLQFRMHSVTSTEDDASETDATPSEPVLSFWDASAEPTSVRPGDMVRLAVGLNDSEGRVDTIGATLHAATAIGFDLYDNGSHGDEKARDGVWSYTLEVPPNAGAGHYLVTIAAYGRNGQPVMRETESGEMAPLQAEVGFEIIR